MFLNRSRSHSASAPLATTKRTQTMVNGRMFCISQRRPVTSKSARGFQGANKITASAAAPQTREMIPTRFWLPEVVINFRPSSLAFLRRHRNGSWDTQIRRAHAPRSLYPQNLLLQDTSTSRLPETSGNRLRLSPRSFGKAHQLGGEVYPTAISTRTWMIQCSLSRSSLPAA